jgi:hypothetical protein
MVSAIVRAWESKRFWGVFVDVLEVSLGCDKLEESHQKRDSTVKTPNQVQNDWKHTTEQIVN